MNAIVVADPMNIVLAGHISIIRYLNALFRRSVAIARETPFANFDHRPTTAYFMDSM